MVYLPVKFRCKSVYFPWRYSPAIQTPTSSVTMESAFSLERFSAIPADLDYVLLLDSLSLSSCALPGTYLPSLLPQSLLFSASTFSSSVLRHAHTLVASSLSLDLKIHTWSSLVS